MCLPSWSGSSADAGAGREEKWELCQLNREITWKMSTQESSLHSSSLPWPQSTAAHTINSPVLHRIPCPVLDGIYLVIIMRKAPNQEQNESSRRIHSNTFALGSVCQLCPGHCRLYCKLQSVTMGDFMEIITEN